MFAFNFFPLLLVSSGGAFFSVCLSYFEGGCAVDPRPGDYKIGGIGECWDAFLLLVLWAFTPYSG